MMVKDNKIMFHNQFRLYFNSTRIHLCLVNPCLGLGYGVYPQPLLLVGPHFALCRPFAPALISSRRFNDLILILLMKGPNFKP